MPSQERVKDCQAKKEQKKDNPKSRIMTVQERVKGKSRRMPNQERGEECQAKKEYKIAKPRKSRRMPSQESVYIEECQAKKE